MIIPSFRVAIPCHMHHIEHQNPFPSMSTANVQAFFAKARTDHTLQQKIDALDDDATATGLIILSREYRLPFDEDALAAFLTDADEFADEELRSISGGGVFQNSAENLNVRIARLRAA